MVTATRTLNPLPFGDLETKRFEDLVRQLAYEFKLWRRLEATGRSGSDEGFDARGYEIVEDSAAAASGEVEEEESAISVAGSDRLWLIQCKREKRITPAQMRAHLAGIVLIPGEPLYGLIFAAACDFSKATRDVLAAWCRANGVTEWHIWGKGELEDMLFQPRFDNLLFAYFGISLTIRRRSRATELRGQIAVKRKLKRFIDGNNDGLVLLRDIEDHTYPAEPPAGQRPRFRVRRAVGIAPDGLRVRTAMKQAWLSVDGTEWDAALAGPGIDLTHGTDRWNQPLRNEALDELASSEWSSFPDEEQAWVYAEAVVPYKNIVIVDDVGDEEFGGPHVYVTGWDQGYPGFSVRIESVRSRQVNYPEDPETAPAERVEKFSSALRALPPDVNGL